MKYSLDTNACVKYLTGRAPQLSVKVNSTPIWEIGICSIVRAEFFYGAQKSQNPAQTLSIQQQFLNSFQTLPFDDQAALTYGQIRASLEKIGTPIGPMDTMIAAITVANQLILVTHNTREFSRIAGLQIEDWEI